MEVDTEENVDENESQSLENKMQTEIEKPLDPRAGRVDVELPQIPFNATKIVEMLSSHQFHPSSNATSRRQVSRLIQEYVCYAILS